MEIPVSLLKLTGLLIIESLIIVFIKIYKYKLRIPSIKLACNDDIPDYIKHFLVQSSKRMERLNFSFYHYFYFEGLISDSYSGNWGVILINKSRSTFAFVKLTDLMYEKNTCYIEFITYFLDGKSLLTINDYKDFIIGCLPNTILNDARSLTIEQHWYSHINRIDKIKDMVIVITPDIEEVVSLENKKAKKYIDLLINEKLIKIREDSRYSLFMLPAFFYTLKVLKGIFKHTILNKKKSGLSNEFIPVPVELLIEQYRKKIQGDSGGWKYSDSRIFLLIINLFLIAFAGILFSINVISISIAMILIFEFSSYLDNKLT